MFPTCSIDRSVTPKLIGRSGRCYIYMTDKIKSETLIEINDVMDIHFYIYLHIHLFAYLFHIYLHVRLHIFLYFAYLCTYLFTHSFAYLFLVYFHIHILAYLHIYLLIYLHALHILSSLWVSCTGSPSDWCGLQETLYKCIDTIQYNIHLVFICIFIYMFLYIFMCKSTSCLFAHLSSCLFTY